MIQGTPEGDSDSPAPSLQNNNAGNAALADKVYRLLAERRWNVADLARKTHLAESGLGRILSGATKNPRRATLARIAQALDVDVAELVPSPRQVVGTCVSIRAADYSVLEADAIIDEVSIEALIERMIAAYARTQSEDPDVSRLVDAIGLGRANRADTSSASE